ncbi:hypothetical protein [Streptomyces sp. NPDC049881]|uniref:hypothetical protein n=1 Tax=Streptomyces sp. NPDC049881 TaxID=3155778 RepID=UPI00343EA762
MSTPPPEETPPDIPDRTQSPSEAPDETQPSTESAELTARWIELNEAITAHLRMLKGM